MKRRSSPRNSHPAADELARLANADSRPEPRIVEHLMECRRCMAVYAEFAEMRSHLLSETGIEPPPVEWIARGLKVAATHRGAGRPAPAGGRAAWRITAVGATIAVALLAAALSTRQTGLSEGRRALARQVREDSHGSLLYSEDLLPIPRGIRGTASDGKADAMLARLARRYDQGARSRDDVFWLVAGFLSQNDLNNADAHLRESLQAFPADVRFQNLAAILAFKRNDLAAAASHLEAALAGERSAGTLLNLAVVRREQGRHDEARELALEIVNSFPGSAISLLAKEMARS